MTELIQCGSSRSLLVRNLLFGYSLLLLSAILPIFGWHRVWLRIDGWWTYPLASSISFVGITTGQKWLIPIIAFVIIADALALWQLILEKHRAR